MKSNSLLLEEWLRGLIKDRLMIFPNKVEVGGKAGEVRRHLPGRQTAAVPERRSPQSHPGSGWSFPRKEMALVQLARMT